MAKRVFALVFTSSVITALLLFVGTAIVGKFSPAFASSSLPGLVAGSQALLLGDNATAEAGMTSTPDPTETVEVSSTPDVSQTPEVSSTPQPSSTPVPPGATDDDVQGTPVTGVSIAELLGNSGQYLDGVFTITGMASVLNGDKLLLNDGTGQILVDLEDDLMQYMAQNGSTITVTGEFSIEGGQAQFALEACVVADQNGTFVLDTCEFRHGNDDDMDDDSDDDHSGISDDDHSGISDDDGSHHDSDDDHSGMSDDDSDHDSDDDHSGSGSDSSDDDSDDSSGSGSDDHSGSGKNRP
ncbi:MAG: hypothetical protein HY835_04120 [Anaerolineae bacterium]|nr:hypothetical protein [Anaerolineae bacterium]